MVCYTEAAMERAMEVQEVIYGHGQEDHLVASGGVIGISDWHRRRWRALQELLLRV